MVKEPFYPFREHFAIDLNGARAVFTTRRGGFSSGPYSSLNLGRLTADDPDVVARNRTRLEPANTHMKPIYRDTDKIMGVLVGVVRKY